ncbi:MAG: UDP-N-acetylmuramoyl-L-alanine--D-glutamate ligase [Oscillibacter sp.]|nr:UDP-N-acetylmuramoyl-L-alanine--D-glutamate ligase [Oscillibacter sp.]
MDLEEYLSALRGKRVAAIGAGVSNRPLIDLLLSHGADVTACDKKPDLGAYGEELRRRGCRLQLGADYLKGLGNQDVIFRSPGVRPDLPEFLSAIANGARLTSEMEAFFDLCPCPKIAVTGSDGKTTTTTIIAKLLEAAGKRVHLGGNIGRPLLADTPDIRPGDVAVLELSSFQLMTMRKSPEIAVVTNISPNHLDVHKDYAEYIAAKENIFAHQNAENLAVFNADNAVTLEQSARAPGRVRLFSRRRELADGVCLRGQDIVSRRDGKERVVMTTADIRLPGVHNIENYMAAIAAVDGLVPDEIIRKFAREFAGVEHRIELVRTRNGVRWYNDSIASSPSRTIAGLNSFPEKVILIAGGKDKGISYKGLGPVVNDHVKYLILCGATAGVIRESVEAAENYRGLPVEEVGDYPSAVSLADSIAKPGDVVILSPASTSFDRFANFAERGNVFKELVNALP